jgi:polyphosphate kinase
LAEVLEAHFRDNNHAYRMESDGTYSRIRAAEGEPERRVQEMFQRAAEETHGVARSEVKEGIFQPHLPFGRSKITPIDGN